MVVESHLKFETQNQPTAFVADDDAIMRDILRSLLIDAGYVVILAANGREALTSAADLQASIAFIDLAMPEGNGLQICSALRKMPKWSYTPIIVLTHFSLNQALEASLDAGANGFLCKPLVPSEFLWCLEVHTKTQQSIVKKQVPQIFPTDKLNFTNNRTFLSRSSRLLQPPQPLLERQIEFLKNLKTAKNAHTGQAIFPFNISCGNLSQDYSKLSLNTSISSYENIVGQIISHQANLQNGAAYLAPDMKTLHNIATLFPSGGLVRLLGLLVALVEEILSRLCSGDGVASSHALLDLLHKLAGTAATLGCGSLTAAAKELEYNFSSLAKNNFIEVSSSTLQVIKMYIAERSDRISAASSFSKSRILVVDDTFMNRDIANSFLCAAGHLVTCVEGGAAAVAAVAKADFDIVLMDVRMPEVDGLEATRRIRKLKGTRGKVPIVALTAQTFVEQIAEFRKAGMNGHLTKPFNLKTLLAAVETTVYENQHRKVN